MRTYQELTPEQQDKARIKALERLLTDITEGLRFNDAANGDDLQARIDAAGEKSEAMQTPWFWHEYIMDTCRDELESMAAADAEDAEDALYPEPGERVLYI